MHRSQRDVYDAHMEVAVTAPPAPPKGPVAWRRRAMPILCGCALAGAAALVAVNDPSAPVSRFPACQFHAMTGLWCPGCGLTRGFHQLLTGHLGAAMSYNVFVPLVLVAVVARWWSWLRTSWGHRGIRLPAAVSRHAGAVIAVAMVVYGVLRNIPVAPFRSLAP
jgi:hypothetical protein